MENSNRLIEEEVQFDKRKYQEDIYLSQIAHTVDSNRRKDEDRYVNWDKVIPELRMLLQRFHIEVLNKVRQETLKEVESKLPKDTELPVLEETKDELSDMLRNARKYMYIDWHGIGIRNNTLSEVRKIISKLKK